MRSVKYLVAAGAASLLSSAAFAADMPMIQPAPPMYAPPPVEDFGGWYLRGDIGFSNQNISSVRDTNPAAYNNVSVAETSNFGSAGIYGGGVGYQFNNWFRADITGQYRGNSNFTGLDVVTGTGPAAGFVGTNNYSATKSELLFLANAYADLGTWYCITPYVGAGIGAARVTIANFTDSGVATLFPAGSGVGPSLVSAANGSQWNFAWALHAGLAYKVNPNMTVELGYSYVDLGNGTTGVDSTFDHSAGGHVFQFHNITSQDVKLGVRWNLESPPAYMPPLVTKG